MILNNIIITDLIPNYIYNNIIVNILGFIVLITIVYIGLVSIHFSLRKLGNKVAEGTALGIGAWMGDKGMQTVSDMLTNPNSQGQGQNQGNPQPQGQPNPQPEVQANPQPEVQANPQPEIVSNPDVKTNSNPQGGDVNSQGSNNG